MNHPKKPYAPSKPFEMLTRYHRIDIKDKSLKYLMEVVNKLNLKLEDVLFDAEAEDDGAMGIAELYAFYPENYPNPNYEKQLAKYEKEHKQYRKDLKKYNADMKEYDIWLKETQIKNLKAALEKLTSETKNKE